MEVKNNTTKTVVQKRPEYMREEKTIKPFFVAYSNLKINDSKVVKSVICELCNLSYNYFLMKKNGQRGITFHEETVIRSTFQCFNIDAFTGEPIQKS